MSIVDSFKESEQLLVTQVKAVEELYFSMTGEKDMRFTDKFRMEVKGIIRKYGIAEVFETAQNIVEKFGENGLDKLIPYTKARHSPQGQAKYICGIIRNKLRLPYGWLRERSEEYAYILEIVSELMSIGGKECLDHVIELAKYRNYESYDECVAMIDWEGKQWAYQNKHPKQIQAEQNVPIEYETMYSAAKKEPDEMVVVDYDSDAYEKKVLANYEAGLLLKYGDKVDEWHIVSKRKYNGKGFTDIARTELDRQVKNKKRQNYKQADVDTLARNIERKIKARRKNLGITENE